MSWRRAATVLTVAVSALGAGGPVWADSLTVTAGTATGAGTVTLTRTVDSTTEDANFAVAFQGTVVGHGWTYTGTVSGTGTTWSYAGGIAEPPYLSMSSDDGSVTGWCGGGSQTADTVGSDTIDMEFRCVLARNGGTPWETELDAVVARAASLTSSDTWTGRYTEADITTPAVAVDGGPTYGAVQLGQATSNGAIDYGPLRFSGQIAIGSVLYRGDLVSGTSGFITSSDIPPLTMSGTSGGITVSGTCAGSIDSTLSNVTWTYDFTCSLATGSAPAVTVSLRGVFPTESGACSFRDCWGDEAGSFTSS